MQLSDYQIFNKVKKILHLRNMTFKDLCEGVKMTEQGLSGSLKNGTIKFDTLIQISHFLEVDIKYFIDDENNFNPYERKDEFGSKYLMDILSKIEKQMSEQVEQLRRKDEQISQLLQTNNALVMNSLKKDNPTPEGTNVIKVDFLQKDEQLLA